MSVEYQYYQIDYGGDSIPSDQFDRLQRRAAEQLARYKRIYTVTAPDADSERMAICAMADALYYYECAQNGIGGPISSASIGSVSVSYGSASGSVDMSPAAQEREMYRAACLYLDIYRGCGGC